MKDQEKRDNANRQSAQGMIYESRDQLHMSKKHRSSTGITCGTGQRRKKSKKFSTESEEYDSLNSDSDIGDTVSRELDATSRTESSNCLDDPGPASFSSKKKYFIPYDFTLKSCSIWH